MKSVVLVFTNSASLPLEPVIIQENKFIATATNTVTVLTKLLSLLEKTNFLHKQLFELFTWHLKSHHHTYTHARIANTGAI